MKKHGLLIVLFVFSSGCALFGGSTTEEPAGCLAHPDQPQPNDARHYKASDAVRDLEKRREAAEAAKRAAEQPPAQEKPAEPQKPVAPPASPTSPKKEGKSASVPKERRKEQPLVEQPKPPADPELQKLKLEAEKCAQVVEAKRDAQKLREQLEEARRKLREQAAQTRPEPEDLPQTPMRPQYTANGSWWSWRTLGEGLGILFAWLLLILRGEAGLKRWGHDQAARADSFERKIKELEAEIAKLQAQLQQQQAPKT